MRNNISHDNVQKAGNRTDGNGIIIDDFHHDQNPGWPNYTYPTLVDGNVVYHNGGKGIAVHWSDNVTVSNNTAYHNNLDNGNKATWRGELSQQDSANNVWVNNIAVADPSTNPNNTAIGFYGGNSGTKWFNNITFNGNPGQASLKLEGGNNPAPTAANGNKLGVDPLFVDPANDDFHLRPGSPAINAGTSSFGLGSVDIDGDPRAIGTVDIGADEVRSSSAANQAPRSITLSAGTVAETSGAGTVVGQISAVDPDGDALVFAVAGDSRFAVNGTGKLVVANGADLSVTGDEVVPLTITANDGRGGVASAGINVTILDTPAPTTIVRNDAASVAEDKSVVVDVLANDAAGAALTGVGAAAGVAGPAHGAVAIVNGEVRYTPSADYNGSDSFQYVARSASGVSATGRVDVTVTPVNDAPVGVDDGGFRTAAGAPIRIDAASLLANDRDVDGDALSLTGVSGAVNGAVARDGGDVIFTPTAGASGAASFVYTLSDGKGGVATAKVNLTIDAASGGGSGGGGAGEAGFSLWNRSATPGKITDSDNDAVELGVTFKAGIDGEVSSLYFYKGPQNDGPHIGKLWTTSGDMLVSVAFGSETAQGWQKVDLDRPLQISAGETYIASYHAPKGHYSVDEGFFAQPLVNGPLTGIAGVYAYGGAGSFPVSTYKASNYWVDLTLDATKATHTGGSGRDSLSGGSGADVMLGKAGDDSLTGRAGDDMLRGQAGNDLLKGNAGSDILIGGTGADRFIFTSASHSPSGAGRDEIQAGDGAVAFEGAGRAGGDLIDLKGIDANTTSSGNQAFVFGSTDKGGISLFNVDGNTLVRGNIDNDAAFEFEVLIVDGAVSASAYTAADFIL